MRNVPGFKVLLHLCSGVVCQRSHVRVLQITQEMTTRFIECPRAYSSNHVALAIQIS